mmetsp:Transcript_16167/g.19263  ORF Transcript_16167/g.19263 Transcript_16167/m.19263 type:complete len:97 (+) Transcript_16167:827-1117(+)
MQNKVNNYNSRSCLTGSRLSTRKEELRSVNTRRKPIHLEKHLVAITVELFESDRKEFEKVYVDKKARKKYKAKMKELSAVDIAKSAIAGDFRVDNS